MYLPQDFGVCNWKHTQGFFFQNEPEYELSFTNTLLRAVLKNQCGNVSQYYDICIVSRPMHRDTYRIVKSLPKPSLKVQWHKTTPVHFNLIPSISVFHCFQCVKLKSKSALKFHFHFDVAVGTSVCLVIFQHHSNT